MAKTVDASIGSSLLKFTFSDSDGDVVASFRLNPADVKLAARCEEVSRYFESKKGSYPQNATLDDVVKYNDELEEKICYLLGYDAKENLFGLLSATTILPNGEMFALKVVNKIAEAVKPELAKRKQKMQAAVAKHTAKYTK